MQSYDKSEVLLPTIFLAYWKLCSDLFTPNLVAHLPHEEKHCILCGVASFVTSKTSIQRGSIKMHEPNTNLALARQELMRASILQV